MDHQEFIGYLLLSFYFILQNQEVNSSRVITLVIRLELDIAVEISSDLNSFETNCQYYDD